MSDNIPPELITVILSRLPVKTLLHCRCVSKQWRSIIDSQEFHKSHLSRSIETNSNSYIIANSRYLEIYFIKTDALDKALKIESPIGRWYILGSCNGIILMGCGELKGKDRLALLNPATRTKHFLPEDNAPFFTGFYTKTYKEVFGFGYDSIGNDFKVVSIMKIDSVCVTNIFSLKSNSWKRIKDFPYKRPCLFRWGVHVNSALHAVVDQNPNFKCSKSIVALDLSLEDYRWMEFTDISTEGVEFDLSKLGQCLCLCAYTNIKTDIWVMKEYGMARSWTKLLSIDLPGHVSGYGSLNRLAYSKDGDKVLLHYNTCTKFIWYDLRSKQFNHVDMSNSSLDMIFNAGVCIESLVQLGTREKTKKMKERDDFLSVGFKLKL